MRSIKVLIVFILTLSCSSAKGVLEIQEENLEVLNHVLENSKGGIIYYKSINYDLNELIGSFVINGLNFDLCIKDIDSSLTKFSDQESSYLSDEFNKQNIVRIDRLKPEFEERTVKKHERFETVSISIPVVFRNGTMAIYYYSGTYGGGFNLLQKNSDNWEVVCSNSVWIE